MYMRVQTRAEGPGEMDLFKKNYEELWEKIQIILKIWEKILKVLVLVHVLIQILIAVDRKLGIYASLASLEFWNVKGWKQCHVIGHCQQFFCKWLVKLYGKINECPVISMEKQLKITYFSLSNNSLSMWNTSEKNVIYIKNIVCV